MAILVTGTGFVGGYVARDLLEQGQDVVLYGYFGGKGDTNPTLELPDLAFLDELLGGGLFDKVKVVVGDITDGTLLRSTMEKHEVTGVVHLAAMLGKPSESAPPLATHVNAFGTMNVFDAAVDLGVENVTWASSVTVFGPDSINESGVIAGDSPYDPRTVYAATKIFNEHMGRWYYENHGLNAIGVRPNRVYGYGEHTKRNRGSGSGWFFEALYNAALSSSPSEWLFGDKSMDFHHVEDVAAAFVAGLSAPTSHAGNSYLTGGDFRPIREAFEFVRSLVPEASMSLAPTPKVLPMGSSTIWATKFDTSDAEKELGLRAKVSMEDGLLRTVNGYRQQAGLPSVSSVTVPSVSKA